MRISDFIPFAFFLVFSPLIHGQATATFTASVTIIQPITINTTSQMDFGGLDARTGGEVILTPQSQRSASGGVTLSEGAAVSAAAFEVTGEPGLTFDISLPESSHSLSNGNEVILIRDFGSSMKGTASLGPGTRKFSVGATLDIKEGQEPGFYTSTRPLAVTVNYN